MRPQHPVEITDLYVTDYRDEARQDPYLNKGGNNVEYLVKIYSKPTEICIRFKLQRNINIDAIQVQFSLFYLNTHTSELVKIRRLNIKDKHDSCFELLFSHNFSNPGIEFSNNLAIEFRFILANTAICTYRSQPITIVCGVLNRSDKALHKLTKSTPVTYIPGIGRLYAARLHRENQITTLEQFLATDLKTLTSNTERRGRFKGESAQTLINILREAIQGKIPSKPICMTLVEKDLFYHSNNDAVENSEATPSMPPSIQAAKTLMGLFKQPRRDEDTDEDTEDDVRPEKMQRIGQ